MGWRHFALDREKRDSQLNDLEEVDVAADGLVVVRGFRVEVADRTSNNSRELGVLCVM